MPSVVLTELTVPTHHALNMIAPHQCLLIDQYVESVLTLIHNTMKESASTIRSRIQAAGTLSERLRLELELVEELRGTAPEEALMLASSVMETALRNAFSEEYMVAAVRIGQLLQRREAYQEILDQLLEVLNQSSIQNYPRYHYTILSIIGDAYCSRGQNRQAMPLLKQALEVAVEFQFRDAQAHVLAELTRCCGELGEINDALDYATQSLQLARSTGRRATEAWALSSLGLAHVTIGEYAKGIQYLKESIDVSDAANLEGRYRIGPRVNLGMAWFRLADGVEALRHFSDALLLAQQIKDVAIQAALNINIGLVHFGDERFSLALEYYQCALQLCRETGDIRLEAESWNYIGNAYGAQCMYTAALEAYTAGISASERFSSDLTRINLLSNLGRILVELERPNDALPYLQEACQRANNIASPMEQSLAYCNLGRCLLNLQKLPEAIVALEQSAQQGIAANAFTYMPDVCQMRSQAARQQGDMETAFHWLQKQLEWERASRRRDADTVRQQMLVKIDLERARSEAQALRQRNEHLEVMLDSKTHELTTMAMNLVKITESFTRMREMIERMTEGDSVTNLHVELLARLDQSNGEGWELFERQLNETRGGFTAALVHHHPDLTSMELRIATLLQINLASKEVATLLNMTVPEVDNYRSRIRKKLGLKEKMGLHEYFAQIHRQVVESAVQNGDEAFTELLRQNCPTLSLAEQKVCALLRINLNTKEIARILSISERTVENHRFRIRKKFGLSSSDNLVTFFAGFSSNMHRRT